MQLKCAPRLGEHNEKILKEIGMRVTDIEMMKNKGIV